MRVIGHDEGQVCVTIRKVIGPHGREFLAMTHMQLHQVLRTQLASRDRDRFKGQVSHKQILSCTDFGYFPDHYLGILFPHVSFTKASSDMMVVHDEWTEMGAKKAADAGKEPLDFIQGGIFLHKMSDCGRAV